MLPRLTDRRTFLKQTSLAAASVLAFGGSARAAAGGGTPPFFVGTTINPDVVFLEGADRLLDRMRDLAGINTVLVFANTLNLNMYRRGRRHDNATSRRITETWTRSDPRYFAGAAIGTPHDPGDLYADRDVLDELAGPAAERGMRVYARLLEPYRINDTIPGLKSAAEVDADGAPGENACLNHPDYIRWWDAVITELVELHPGLEGFKFGQERGGPLGAVVAGGAATCFCEHCLARGRERGLDAASAREGFRQMRELARSGRAGDRPVDGFFVSWLRVLQRHPALLAWDAAWYEAREEQRRRIHRLIKRINPAVRVGWHIDHGVSWNLFDRAQLDYGAIAGHTDWVSVAVYFDCMGRRLHGHFQRSIDGLLFRDAPPDTSYPMYLRMLGYDPALEPAEADLRKAEQPFSAEYVYSETRRAVLGAAGRYPVYARVGFDIGLTSAVSTPEAVHTAVNRALDAGADGLLAAREWHEAEEANLAAFGRAVRERIGKT